MGKPPYGFWFGNVTHLRRWKSKLFAYQISTKYLNPRRYITIKCKKTAVL